MRQPEKTKAAILESVTRVLVDEGADAVTIDEVAKRAAISKGGVLHHFRSKEALLDAAFAYHFEQFNETIDRLQQQDPAAPGAYTRAYLRACVDAFSSPSSDCMAFLYQFRATPGTARLVLSYKERWQQRVEEDGLDPAIAHLVRYASDGIWLAATVRARKPKSFKAIVENLLDLCAPGSGPDGSVERTPQ
jgi:AcrR family transcriptional regulator